MLFFLSFFSLSLLAKPSVAVLEFEQKDYSAAFQKLRENPVENAYYYQNLGITAFHLKKKELMSAFFLKALILDPYNSSAKKLLETAEKETGGEPVISQTYRIIKRLQTQESTALIYCLIFITLFFWTHSVFRQKAKGLHFFKTRNSVISSLPLILALAIAIIKSPWLFPIKAICLEETDIYSGPSDQFLTLAHCKEAQDLISLKKILFQDDQAWIQIKTTDPTPIQGWIARSKLLEF
jgi:hypothetical protein